MSTGVPRLLGSGPGAITAFALPSLSAPGRYAYRKFSLIAGGKNRVSPILNLTGTTPFLFPVYVCPLSAVMEFDFEMRIH